MKFITIVFICLIVAVALIPDLVFGGPAKKYGLGKDLSSEEGSNSDEVTTSPNEIAVGRSFTCNSMTGDFLCAGWPGAWRCQCGSACYNN
ncbi:unnamed protein product, partial [Rotaria sp. Silwood1]